MYVCIYTYIHIYIYPYIHTYRGPRRVLVRAPEGEGQEGQEQQEGQRGRLSCNIHTHTPAQKSSTYKLFTVPIGYSNNACELAWAWACVRVAQLGDRPKKNGQGDRLIACTRKRGWYGWRTSSSSNFSIRAFRAYPLIEIRQTVPCRSIRGNSISVNSTLPPSYANLWTRLWISQGLTQARS